MPNLTQIARSIPGSRNAINALKTKSTKNLEMLALHGQRNSGLLNKAIQGAGSLKAQGEQIHNKAASWVRDKLGYSTDTIGNSDLNIHPMPETITQNKIKTPSNWWGVEDEAAERFRSKRFPYPEDRDAGMLEGVTVEMKPIQHNHTIGESVNRMPDIEHFITNYIGSKTFGEPLLTDRFMVAITNPTSAYNPNVIEKFGSPTNQSTIDNITFFACRTTSLPGKEISTYQYTTHGAEHDYPYITSYDTIDMSFICSSASAIERRWFDGWMASIIDPETMSVGYKDDFSTNISIGILSAQLLHNEILTAELHKAYPVSVSSIELDHSNSELMEFTVTFAYDKWMYKEIVE